MKILDKDRREMYALDIIALSNGGLARGTIYLYLSRLEENNFVSSRPEDNPKYEGLARSLYKITDNGVRAVLEHQRKEDEGLGGLLVPA